VDSDARRIYISRGVHVVVLDADTYAVIGDIPDTQASMASPSLPASAAASPVTVARMM